MQPDQIAGALPRDAFRAHGVAVETALVAFDKTDVNEGPVEASVATLEEALAARCARPGRAAAGTPECASTPVVALRAARPTAPAAEGLRVIAPGPTPTALVIRREQPAPLDHAATCTEADAAPNAAGAAAAGGLYAPCRVARIAIPGAAGHPTPLVESAAMAAITPPAPSHRPLLAPSLIRRGALSDAQLETLVYAGEAFAQDLPGAVRVGADAVA